MAYKPNDHYARKAKTEGFEARSVYKLEEIDKKYQLFKSGMTVIDLGCSPGSWSQYAAFRIAPKGKLLGLDLKPVQVGVPCAVFIEGDIMQVDIPALLALYDMPERVDAVISDMAPQTSGIRIRDQALSYELCIMALQTARRCLRTGGFFICKFFDGPDFHALRAELQSAFTKVATLRPQSVRKESKELFFIATGFKGQKATENPESY